MFQRLQNTPFSLIFLDIDVSLMFTCLKICIDVYKTSWRRLKTLSGKITL